MSDIITIRQSEQKNYLKKFAGGGKRKRATKIASKGVRVKK